MPSNYLHVLFGAISQVLGCIALIEVHEKEWKSFFSDMVDALSNDRCPKLIVLEAVRFYLEESIPRAIHGSESHSLASLCIFFLQSSVSVSISK